MAQANTALWIWAFAEVIAQALAWFAWERMLWHFNQRHERVSFEF